MYFDDNQICDYGAEKHGRKIDGIEDASEEKLSDEFENRDMIKPEGQVRSDPRADFRMLPQFEHRLHRAPESAKPRPGCSAGGQYPRG